MEDSAQLQANEVVKSLKGPLQDAIRRVERLAEEFPSERDFHFYNNFPHFRTPVRSIQTQVETLLNGIGLAKNLRPQTAEFPSDPDESYDWLVAVQDDLVEGVDSAVDQLKKETSDGKRSRPYEAYQTPKKLQKGMNSDGSPSESAKFSRGSSERRPVPFHVRSIPRPQIKFDVMVDNSNTPFKHPQALKSDAKKEGLSALDLHARKLGVTFEDMHPLEEDLTRMEYVDQKMLEAPIPQDPRPILETPLSVVSTLSELKDMASKCRFAGEIAVGPLHSTISIALECVEFIDGTRMLPILCWLFCCSLELPSVDLENHHYRSFQGFVCLMQVSTRSEDFIVDALALRSHMSPCLKDIFADAKIRKVLHGADRDIVWLQRDFGIYVCNMFDTGQALSLHEVRGEQAARVLQLEGCGLAFLMQHFLDINPDKRYQLADWRIRPLPAEMIKYAREDTHYLLYLYDLLKVQLVSLRSSAAQGVEDPLLQVYKRSRDICLQMYKKDILTETSYLSLYGLQDKQLNAEQMSVLAGLYAWRDNLARKLDESTGFVLPNQLLYKLAEEMPDSARTLQIAIRGPHSLVGQHAPEVLEVIKQLREKVAISSTAGSLLVRERSETRSILDTQTSDDLSAEVDISNKFTTQAGKTVTESVSTDVPKPMEDLVPSLADCKDVDLKSTTGVEKDTQEEQPRANPTTVAEIDLMAENAETRSIKEITVGPSMSAQVMVKRSAVEDTSPASTINIRRLNTAVVRRASAPSLALFGGSSKKKVSARNVDLMSGTEAVESSSRPGTSDSMIHSEVTKLPKETFQTSKLPNTVIRDTSETATVVAVCSAADHGREECSGAISAFSLAPSEKNMTMDAAGVAGQVLQTNGSDTTPLVSEGGTACVASEVSLGASLDVAGGLVEHEQEGKSVSAADTPSKDCKSLNYTGYHKETSLTDGTPAPSTGNRSSEDVMVPAEEEKTSDTQAVISAGKTVSRVRSAAVDLSAGDKGMTTRRTPGAARHGLGSMLGSSAHRKCQKAPKEDMEMVAAKLRASRIQASVALPFHRIPTIGEPNAEIVSDQKTSALIPEAPGSELPSSSLSEPASPFRTMASSGQEAAPLEEMGDYVRIENMKSESRKRFAPDVATRNRSNWSNQFATEEENPFPRTLSEMRRQPRHQEGEQHPADFNIRRAKHSTLSNVTVGHDNQPQGEPNQKHHENKTRKSPASKSNSDVEANMESSAGEAAFQPFDYEAARREIGLGENLVSRTEDSQSGRGRGRGRPVNPNKRQRQVAPPLTNGAVQAFDPLRRSRQEPRPEGIPAARRRQVFPQTGNRTASFRR